MSRILLFSLFGAALFCACTNASKQDPDLRKAAELHQEAIQIETAVKPLLEQLGQQKNALNIQGRALTEQEQHFIARIEGLEKSYDYWESNHVEVPGFEHADHAGHEHGHDHHGHDHDHGSGLDVTPADMLLIQREFRDSIQAIQQRAEALLQTFGQ